MYLRSGYQDGITGFTCIGDSGCPLMIYESTKGQYMLAGMVSGGSCMSDSLPGIFIRIEDPEILQFIDENVQWPKTFPKAEDANRWPFGHYNMRPIE